MWNHPQNADRLHQHGKRGCKMTDTIILESQNLCLSLDFQVFESDISYPSNTILSVSVTSAGFSVSTTMDFDAKDMPTFCSKLQKLYDSLKGEAKIKKASRSFGKNVGAPKKYQKIATAELVSAVAFSCLYIETFIL